MAGNASEEGEGREGSCVAARTQQNAEKQSKNARAASMSECRVYMYIHTYIYTQSCVEPGRNAKAASMSECREYVCPNVERMYVRMQRVCMLSVCTYTCNILRTLYSTMNVVCIEGVCLYVCMYTYWLLIYIIMYAARVCTHTYIRMYAVLYPVSTYLPYRPDQSSTYIYNMYARTPHSFVHTL